MNRRDFLKNTIYTMCGMFLFSNSGEAFALKPSDKKAEKLLQKHSLVIYKNHKIKYCEGRGIKPLLDYLENDDFSGAFVADKRIGKASALLLAYGKAKEVYTPLISQSAIKVFEKYNIKYSASKTIDFMMNHANTDLCPMEKKVLNIDDPAKAYEIFKQLNK